MESITSLKNASSNLRLQRSDIERGIPSVFEERVLASPDRIALQTPEHCLSYEVLNRRANQVAHSLMAAGLDTGDLVAIAVESPPALAISLLGVLKAGGVAVFLDLKSPVQRLTEILAESGAGLLVLDESTPALSPADPVGHCDLREVHGQRATNPERPIPADALMAIYFTSGTTGRPKGIARTHQQGLYEAWLYIRALDLVDSDCLLMPVSFTFGASTRYSLGAWLAGATLCPVAPEAMGVPGLVRFLRQVSATIYYSTPSLYRHVGAALELEPPLESIRAVTLTGEPARRGDLELLDRFLGGRPGIFLNSLGSTECGAYCHLVVTPGAVFSEEVLPVGQPLEGKVVWILDDEHRPVVDGEPGEIAVQSAYLTPGYWKRPDLDRERFLSGMGDCGDRTFLTGDYGFRDSSGRIHVIGRRDQQLKVRGYRLEPAEIEGVLHRFPGVRGAVVHAAVDPGGQSFLVASLVLDSGQSDPVRADLDRHVLDHLPAYMVPAQYRVLEALPLTHRGKTDRRAVETAVGRALGTVTGKGGVPSSLPSTESESRLVQIWEEVLQRKPIGIHDNFFDLGGQSLLALRLVTTLQERLQWPMTLSDLLTHPTIAELARLQSASTDSSKPGRAFRGRGSGIPWFHIPGLFGFEFLTPSFAERIGHHAPYHDGLQLPGVDGRTKPETTIPGMAAALVPQIQRLYPQGPLRLSGYSMGGLLAYEVACQLSKAGRPVDRVLLVDAQLMYRFRRRRRGEQILHILQRFRDQPRGRRVRWLSGVFMGKWKDHFGRGNLRVGVQPQSSRERMARIGTAAANAFRPLPYAGAVTLLRATRLGDLDPSSLEKDPWNGWQPFLHPDFEIREVDTDHAHAFLEPVADSVLRELDSLLTGERSPGFAKSSAQEPA